MRKLDGLAGGGRIGANGVCHYTKLHNLVFGSPTSNKYVSLSLLDLACVTVMRSYIYRPYESLVHSQLGIFITQ
jgi:hypothetical protein